MCGSFPSESVHLIQGHTTSNVPLVESQHWKPCILPNHLRGRQFVQCSTDCGEEDPDKTRIRASSADLHDGSEVHVIPFLKADMNSP